MAISTQTNSGLNDPNDSRASAGNMRFALLPPFASTHSPKCGARVGSIVFARRSPSCADAGVENGRENGHELRIDTPGLITSTSRGVVPHLSRDHHRSTSAIRWVHVPFETFFEHNPPVPTLQNGDQAFHKFLGFRHEQHVLSMSLRDPYDGRTMPPNGNSHVSVYSLRGVRKVAPSEWRTYAYKCQPDIVFALSDTPFTDPPYSQKRLTKSIERSTAWLIDMLHAHAPESDDAVGFRPDVFVHLAGMTSGPARRAFAEGLAERLHGREAEAVAPLRCLDEGVSGYVFDLVPLRLSLEAAKTKQQLQTKQLSKSDAPLASVAPAATLVEPSSSPSDISLPQSDADQVLDAALHPLPTKRGAAYTSDIASLMQTSLAPLAPTKPRVANSTQSPHEVLHLVRDVGIDLFDAHWAQRAADVGVALDFRFPVARLAQGRSERRDIGHNLYHSRYALDFSPLADSFAGAASSADREAQDICFCAACSPLPPSTKVAHDALAHKHDDDPWSAAKGNKNYKPPYSRAYIHHLLHTHEMTAHSLLAMHNLSVLDAFFAGIRAVLAPPSSASEPSLYTSSSLLQDVHARLENEIKAFEETYDDGLAVFDEARVDWKKVELARGKGRLAREKAKQEEGTLGTAVDFPNSEAPTP